MISNKMRAFGASVLGLGSAVFAHAQEGPTVPNMDTAINNAGESITSVLVIVGGTVVFFTILAIYKWVKKR